MRQHRVSLSFRTKLILAMTLIVISATGAIAWVTQKRVRATNQRMFESQFQIQLRFFSEKVRILGTYRAHPMRSAF